MGYTLINLSHIRHPRIILSNFPITPFDYMDYVLLDEFAHEE